MLFRVLQPAMDVPHSGNQRLGFAGCGVGDSEFLDLRN